MSERLVGVIFDVETIDALRALVNLHDSSFGEEVRSAVAAYVKTETENDAS